MNKKRPLNMAEILQMLKDGRLTPEQSRIEWENAYLRAGLPSPYAPLTDNDLSFIQYPLPPKPCYDDDMLLIPYDEL